MLIRLCYMKRLTSKVQTRSTQVDKIMLDFHVMATILVLCLPDEENSMKKITLVLLHDRFILLFACLMSKKSGKNSFKSSIQFSSYCFLSYLNDDRRNLLMNMYMLMRSYTR
jgi:hypothetical protein